nr:immunoglobulin heavy chain junction region [Macaca mulatta]MOW23612.1 immunoglobulin heavy chain junction region [Macaca mulatta]MOW23687.1 immunoglobulin heavy chain junction region [Macaca mulatta]MOW24743.1 immunoglobulin heavy chain junction region [Macaca mulatta]MOW25264.1 immunoglobulin heavy chain junction region [Macaca mulatta]
CTRDRGGPYSAFSDYGLDSW